MIEEHVKLQKPAGPLAQVSYGHPDPKVRFSVVVSGRRVGKTEQALLSLIRETVTCPDKTWKNWYIGNTLVSAVDVAWQRLKILTPNKIVHDVNETRKEITLVNGNSMSLQGTDKENRLVGSSINYAVLDEYAKMKANAWQFIRPGFSNTKGRALFIGTPLGFNHFKKLYNDAEKEENFDWYAYPVYPTALSPWVPAEEIEAARRTMDSLFFQQEYFGKFTNYRGLVYNDFIDKSFVEGGSLKKHDFDPNLETFCGLDFGWTHEMAIIWLQYNKFTDEWFVLRDSLIKPHITTVALKAILREGEYVSPDGHFSYIAPVPKEILKSQAVTFVSGVEANQKRQEADGFSMGRILRNGGIKVHAKSQRIYPGLMALRAYIKNDYGDRRFWVDPRGNRRLRDDFLTYHYAERDGMIIGETPEKDDISDHSMDAIRYTINWRTPLKYMKELVA